MDTYLIPLIEKIGAGRVLVTGDVMLDRYWYGATSRISPEAPVPVVKVADAESRPGGSANVAMNVGSLGTACDMVAVTGNDADARELEQKLSLFNINVKFHRINGFKTISKLRIVSQNQQLIRIDHEDAPPLADRSEIERFYVTSVAKADIVVISDYAKGTLVSTPEWIAEAVKKGKPVIIDPKGTDFSKYRNATLITPNYKEFEAVVGKCGAEADILQKAGALVHDLGLKALLITRGETGMTLVTGSGRSIHVPAQTREVFDVTGAGDTVVAALAASMAAGVDLESAVRIANYAAGIVVSKLGTAFVTRDEIKAALKRDAVEKRAPLELGIMTVEHLADVLTESRRRGEKIVMTNGCFDILHPGHAAYLEKARQLGDRLIVAVNSDDSVRRLKGDARPVNPSRTRMAMLAALSATDWIVEFGEDTPAELIARLKPDILVKGGDYAVADIAGSDTVIANGGRVVLMDYIQGFSTTDLINRIKE